MIRMGQTNRAKGFTIVELLIVVVVIAILAAITIVTYSGIQERARVSSVANGITEFEKIMRLKATEDGMSVWWGENSIPGSVDGQLDNLIAGTSVGNYINEEPQVPGLSGLQWVYDNDSDVYNGCSASANGVNILVYNLPSTVVQRVDDMLDDGNTVCGNLRVFSGILVWGIADHQSEI